MFYETFSPIQYPVLMPSGNKQYRDSRFLPWIEFNSPIFR